jgi:hypothetical protein
MKLTSSIDRAILRLEEWERNPKLERVTKQLIGTVALAVIGGSFWWLFVCDARDELQYLFFLSAGLLAGLAGIRPWWVALALTIVPVAESIHYIQTYINPTTGRPVGICARIGMVFGFLLIAGASALSAFAGNLLVNRRLRRHLSKIVFGPMIFLALVPSASAQTHWYPYGFTVAYPVYSDEYQTFAYTVLYDYSWNQVGSVNMYVDRFANSWGCNWWVFSPFMYDSSAGDGEFFNDWTQQEVSVGIYFLWRAAQESLLGNETGFGGRKAGSMNLPSETYSLSPADSYEIGRPALTHRHTRGRPSLGRDCPKAPAALVGNHCNFDHQQVVGCVEVALGCHLGQVALPVLRNPRS